SLSCRTAGLEFDKSKKYSGRLRLTQANKAPHVTSGSPQESPKSRNARQEIGRQASYHSSQGRGARRRVSPVKSLAGRRIPLGQLRESASREHVASGAD